MKFVIGTAETTPAQRLFVTALSGGIFQCVKRLAISKPEISILHDDIAERLSIALAGGTPFSGNGKEMRALLMITDSQAEQTRILDGALGIEFRIDRDTFEVLQIEFLCKCLDLVVACFEDYKFPDTVFSRLITDLIWDFSALIDGSRVVDGRNGPILPMLAFVADGAAEPAISSGEASWMHEYVISVVDEYFAERPS